VQHTIIHTTATLMMLRTKFHAVHTNTKFFRSCPHRLKCCARLPSILARVRNKLHDMSNLSQWCQLDAQMLIHLLQSSTSTCFEQYIAHPQEIKLY